MPAASCHSTVSAISPSCAVFAQNATIAKIWLQPSPWLYTRRIRWAAKEGLDHIA